MLARALWKPTVSRLGRGYGLLKIFQPNSRISVGDHCWNMDFCSYGVSHFIGIFPYVRLFVILITIVQELGP